MRPRFVIASSGGSDVGRRRQSNQDAYLCDDDLELWVVADGMGGHAAGEVASREAIDTIYGMVKRSKTRLRDGPEQPEAARRLLEGAVQAATYMVYAMAEQDLEKSGMGTTISAMMGMGDYGVTAQVGDSRIYLVRDGSAEQLTEDHTLINWQLKQGIITHDEARRSKHKNVITRAVGNREYVQVDTGMVPYQDGDRFLLCSDGLHSYLRSDEIAGVVDLGGPTAIHRFIDLANARGGKDNITAVLLEIS